MSVGGANLIFLFVFLLFLPEDSIDISGFSDYKEHCYRMMLQV